MKNIFLLIFILIANIINAQDIDDLMDSELENSKEYISATFKSTRIINANSIELVKKQHLNFIISHRFGSVSNGISDFFGIDRSSIRLNLEYGIKDWLTVGIDRSSFNQTYDGYLKLRLLRQSKGKFSIPVSVSYFTSFEVFTRKFTDSERDNFLSSRFSYVHQLLIARKFNDKLSLQLTPSLVHRNLVPTALDMNDLFAVGIGGRYKITNRIAITAEYFYTIRSSRSSEIYNNPIAIGVDIETGGHVFQLMLTNTSLMYEGGFITGNNNDNFFKGGIHFGFNISRTFSFAKLK